MAIKHTFRKDGEGGTKTKMLTPVNAIKHHCRECCGFQMKMVRDCESELCALWPFRNGKTGRPGRKKLETVCREAVSGATIDDRNHGKGKHALSSIQTKKTAILARRAKKVV